MADDNFIWRWILKKTWQKEKKCKYFNTIASWQLQKKTCQVFYTFNE